MAVPSDLFSFGNVADDSAKQRRSAMADNTLGAVSGMMKMAANDNPSSPSTSFTDKLNRLPTPGLNTNTGGWMNDENTGFFQRLLRNGGGNTIPLQ